MNDIGTGVMLCAYCGKPMFAGVSIGGLMYHQECARGPGWERTTDAPPAPGPWPQYTMPAPPALTEADVRRIVREEVAAKSEKPGARPAEPKPATIKRLMVAADAGAKCDVSLVAALDSLRWKHGLTWSEFGAILGLSRPRMSQVKTGVIRLPLRAMRRAYAIGVPADALLQHPTDEAEAA